MTEEKIKHGNPKSNFKEDKTHIWGKFHELKVPGKDVPRHRLCKIEDATHKIVGKRKRKRSQAEYDSYLDSLYAKKLQELTLEFEREKRIRAATTEADRHFFGEAVLEYRDNHLQTLAPKTQEDYERYLDFWNAELGGMILSEITPPLIVGYRDRLKQEIIVREKGGNGNGKVKSKATVNRMMATLSGVLTYCMKEKFWINSNPCSSVSSLKEPDGKERMLSDEEKDRLFEVAKEHFSKLYLALLIALTTGARKMEVWALKANQIHRKNGTITFDKTKTDKKRTVKIVDSVFSLLKTYLEQEPKIGNAFVFPNTYGKNGRKPGESNYDFRLHFEKALDMAEIENFSWHDLRHTSASYHAMSNTPVKTMMDLHGWKTEAMAHRYTHLRTEHLAEAQEKMAEKYLGLSI